MDLKIGDWVYLQAGSLLPGVKSSLDGCLGRVSLISDAGGFPLKLEIRRVYGTLRPEVYEFWTDRIEVRPATQREIDWWLSPDHKDGFAFSRPDWWGKP